MATWIDVGASLATYAADRLFGAENRNASFSEEQQIILTSAFQSLGHCFGEIVAKHLLRLEKDFNSRLSTMEIQLDHVASRACLDEEATTPLEATNHDIARRSKNISRKQRRCRTKERYSISASNIHRSRWQLPTISLYDALYTSVTAFEQSDAEEVGSDSYFEFDELKLRPSDSSHSPQHFEIFDSSDVHTENISLAEDCEQYYTSEGAAQLGASARTDQSCVCEAFARKTEWPQRRSRRAPSTTTTSQHDCMLETGTGTSHQHEAEATEPFVSVSPSFFYDVSEPCPFLTFGTDATTFRLAACSRSHATSLTFLIYM